MITRRPLVLGAATAALMGEAAAQTAADFQGDWFGALDLGAQRLRLRFAIAPGPSTVVYSIDQGNAPIPASETRIEGDRLIVVMAAVNARFEGRLANGRIEGTFTQGGTIPLVLTREQSAEAAPPPEPLTQAALAALRAQAGSPAMAAAAASRAGRTLSLVDGVRAVGRTERATTSDVWHLGSICKSMTSTLVARAVEAGSVAWSDTIGGVLGQAIPDMRAEYRDANFRHLLSHRAGLPANIELGQMLAFPRQSEDARADRIAYARIGLQQAPIGQREQSFEYSNTGYVIAGAMLEAKLGAPWEALIREHVFAPLGMTRAGQGAPGAAGAYDQPVGHAAGPTTVTERGVLTPLVAYPPGGEITDNPAVLGPAGRVHAPFEDVLGYLAAHRDRTQFLRAESWSALHTPPFGGPYAMGWMVRDDGALWHNGSNTLWYAEVLFHPTRGVSSVVATNDGRVELVGVPVGRALLSAAAAVG